MFFKYIKNHYKYHISKLTDEITVTILLSYRSLEKLLHHFIIY
jgi:hypothetical protein